MQLEAMQCTAALQEAPSPLQGSPQPHASRCPTVMHSSSPSGCRDTSCQPRAAAQPNVQLQAGPTWAAPQKPAARTWPWCELQKWLTGPNAAWGWRGESVQHAAGGGVCMECNLRGGQCKMQPKGVLHEMQLKGGLR